MQFKTLAAAAALALAAPAFATILPPTNAAGQINPGDNTELFMVVQDSTAKVSFALDLGVTLGSFISTEAAGPFKLSYNVADDANWATFLSLADPAKTVWAVLALDNVGGAAVANAQRALTTVRSGQESLAEKITNTQLTSSIGGGQGGQFFGSINATGTHKTQDNGSSVNADADSGCGYFGKAGCLRTQFSNAAMVNTNMIGVDSALFLLKSSGGSAGKAITADQFDTNQPVVASFDGNMLQISAVPEPGTYALMLAGLLAVGSLVRRRR